MTQKCTESPARLSGADCRVAGRAAVPQTLSERRRHVVDGAAAVRPWDRDIRPAVGEYMTSHHRSGDHAEHDSGHHEHDIDWDAMAGHLEREAELHLPFLDRAAGWLAGLRGAGDGAVPAAGRVMDVGSGPGVAACALAHAFPGAETVAVDGSPVLLERARSRAAAQRLADRLVTRRADLPDDIPALGPADVIWSSHFVHHLGDQQVALRSLGERLRPGGLLAVAERGLPLRFLPRDIGVGRPGLQARLDAAHEDEFARMRAELPGVVPVVEDWPGMLAGAGLAPARTRTFLTDHPAPLDAPAREYLHTHLSRLRERLADRLDAEDRATLDVLVDPGAEAGVLRRPDAFFLAATTVHTARVPR